MARRGPPLLVQILFFLAALLFMYTLYTTAAPTPAARRTLQGQPVPPVHESQPSTTAVAADASLWLPSSPAFGSSSANILTGCAPSPAVKSKQPRSILPIAPLPCAAGDAAACKIAASAPDHMVLLMVADAGRTALLTAARDSVAPGQLILIAIDGAGAALAQSLGIGWWRPTMAATASPAATQWRASSLLVRAGCTVVVSGGRLKWAGSPFVHLARDVDVEMPQAANPSRGQVVGVHDPPMGWSAYGQTMSCPLLDAHIVALQPTLPAAELAAQMAYRIESRLGLHANDQNGSGRAGGAPPAGESLSMLLTRLVHAPAHDGDSRAGVTMRAMRPGCFGGEPSRFGRLAPSVAALDLAVTLTAEEATLETPGPSNGARGPDSNAILTSRTFDYARRVVVEHGCRKRPTDAGGAVARPLNELLSPADEFPRPSACNVDENMVALCALLKKAAINREVLAAVSNKNIHNMLATFLVGAARAKIPNTLVVALDEATAQFSTQKGAYTYVRKLVSRTGSTDNHATSGLKFQILYEFVSTGCAVLLSDVDVMWLQNPFTLPSLYRDVDVEGMTDGWDDPTAYGYEWGGNHALRLSARNSGLFYLRATDETLAMMGRLKGRMEREAVWDQTAYNEEMWWATLPGQPGHGVSARVMNYYCNMNSKTMFRFMLDDPELISNHRMHHTRGQLLGQPPHPPLIVCLRPTVDRPRLHTHQLSSGEAPSDGGRLRHLPRHRARRRPGRRPWQADEAQRERWDARVALGRGT